MRTGEKGIALIKQFEGLAKLLSDGRVKAYADPATGGKPYTIGFGSTGPDIGPQTIWTQEQCEARLRDDLRKFEDEVSLGIGTHKTTQDQFDAMVSFTYNLGPTNFRKSTLLKKHCAGDFAGAALEFARWDKAAGRVMAGLTRRRAAEARLYRGDAL